MIVKGIVLVLALAFLLLWQLGKKKYGDQLAQLPSEQFPLRTLMPFGQLVMESLGYTYATAYDQRLLAKFNELYGVKRGRQYLQCHWANQVTLGVLLILLVLLFLAGMDQPPGPDVLLFLVLFPLGALYALNEEINKQLKKRRDAIQTDFTEFLNKLILLLNAGMTLKRAWEKIVTEGKENSYFQWELKAVLLNMEGGMPEIEAYESFANRCKVPEIFKFTTLLIQTTKKGSGEMVRVLWLLSNECWLLRKNRARLMGEEASTKLLFPMMMMLAAILLIVATPAILAFQ